MLRLIINYVLNRFRFSKIALVFYGQRVRKIAKSAQV